jgi:hypothetical protein
LSTLLQYRDTPSANEKRCGTAVAALQNLTFATLSQIRIGIHWESKLLFLD